jgi:regulator of sigma E protease
LDNREGNQPESINPLPGSTPPHGPELNGAYAQGELPAQTALDDNAADDDGGFWTPGNIVMLGIILAVFGYLVYNFNLEGLLNIAKAAVGLSFVIFIHELGHFLAAKWCDVNVTTFSIGFGPAIPGCRFKWGETTYKLAILPLGGYVQMVGQVDGDEGSDGSEEDPRSYRRKSVPQRMLIISAGVIMNAILAVVCFIYVYQGPGKDYPAAVVNYVDSSGPAYQQGLRSGAVITKIGTIEDPTFADLKMEVIFTREGQKIEVAYQRPGEKTHTLEIEPRKSASDSMPLLGFGYSDSLKLMAKRGDQESGPCYAGSSAAQAPFHYGNVIVAMTDPAQPNDYRADLVKDLPDDPRYPGHGQRDYFEFWRRLQLLADKDIVVRVRRVKDQQETTADLTVKPMHRLDLGVVMQMGPVLVVRSGSPADTKVNAPDPDKKLDGDLIKAVRVVDADGKVLEFKDKTLDPERLPLQLRQWSDRMEKAHPAAKRMVTLHLSRHRAQPGIQFQNEMVELEWDKDWRFDRVVPFSEDAPMAIPELGLAYQIKSTVAHVIDPQSPLKIGDVIKNIQYTIDDVKPEDGVVPWMRKDLKPGQWAKVSFDLFGQPWHFKKLEFKVERDKAEETVEMPLKVDAAWPMAERGWILLKDVRRKKASSVGEAVEMGFKDTRNRMVEVFLSLRGMITGRIAVNNIAGPLSMARYAYLFAGMDFGDLVFFLGLISINLAVVNFLPVPVLDGGHMVFLIYEGIRGKPASEGVRVVATYIGLALIGCLMIFVLWLDVNRLFFWQR